MVLVLLLAGILFVVGLLLGCFLCVAIIVFTTCCFKVVLLLLCYLFWMLFDYVDLAY